LVVIVGLIFLWVPATLHAGGNPTDTRAAPLDPQGLAPEINNRLVTVRAVRSDTGFAGFDVLANNAVAGVVRFSSPQVQLKASRCEANAAGNTLVFSGFTAAKDCGLAFGPDDRVSVTLQAGDRYPAISFDLTLAGFNSNQWTNHIGQEPFHFLALYLPEAEAWHQRG